MEITLIDRRRPLRFALTAIMSLTWSAFAPRTDAAEAKPPNVGEEAPAFDLLNLDGDSVTLSSLRKEGPVVLIVLRGYPGYQCPLCTRQVGAFLAAAEKLRRSGATVAMIYPGPDENLRGRADEFIDDKTLPGGFDLLLDPGYEFTNAYDLRWDAPRETAYPSTFVIDRDGQVIFAKVSHTHGGRASVEEVLQGLQKV